jgi:arylsulfate sulfotransferase
MTKKPFRSQSRLKKTLILVGAGITTLVLIVLIFLYSPAYSTPAETRAFAKEAVAKQHNIEEQLQAYYQAGEYTFSNPLVVQNPYQSAPLTALLIFDTPEASQISIHVPGKTPLAEVDFTFAGYQQHHEIPVYGLYADTLNHVMVSMKTQNGESAQNEIDLQTEALPVYLQTFIVDRVDPSRYSPGFNFSFQDYKVVFDLNGDVRWYSTQDWFIVFTKLKNGRFLFTLDDHDKKLIVEGDLLGKIHGIYNVPGGIHHDIYELPTGNWLLTSSDMKSNTIYDYLFEVNPNNGHIVRSFDLKNFLDANRPVVIGSNASIDPFHINSIVFDPTDQTIIISSRTQSAVFKMTYPGMQLKWILGAHDNWSAKYQPYLFTPVGENFEWSWAQHHATIFEPHTAGVNVVDILLFDNGTYRSFDPANAQSPLEWYSRTVLYRIDEANMTIEQVWEYGEERGADIFSAFRGSAYQLANGNILGTWADIYKDAEGNPLSTIRSTNINATYSSKVIEVDPSNNEVVFECTSPDRYTYRAMRAGLYDGYLEEKSRFSTPLNDTSGNDLVDRSVLAWQDVTRWMGTVTRWSYTDPVMVALRRIGRQILAVMR